MPETGNPFLDAIREGYLNEDPSRAYNYLFRDQLAQQNPYAKFLRDQRSNYLDQYGSAAVDDLNLSPLSFFGGINPMQQWQSLAPAQRGLNFSQYAPRIKFASLFGGR